MAAQSLPRPAYETIGFSARGASHVDADTACQDSYGASTTLSAAPRCVIALSDGHGAAAHFRSRTGADLAVDALLEAATHDDRAVDAHFVEDVVQQWRTSVAGDLTVSPFASAELGRLTGPERVTAQLQAARAYGSTLLAAVVEDSSLTVIQLGDGDVLWACDPDDVQVAFPDLSSALGDATLSLCIDQAAKHAALKTIAFDEPPCLVVLASDGVRNSLLDPADLTAFFGRLLRKAPLMGPAAVRSAIARLASDCAEYGAGDDATIVMLVRSSVFAGTEPVPASADVSVGSARVTGGPARVFVLAAAPSWVSGPRLAADSATPPAIAAGSTPATPWSRFRARVRRTS